MRIKHVLMVMVFGVLGSLGAADRVEAQCRQCGDAIYVAGPGGAGEEVGTYRCEESSEGGLTCWIMKRSRSGGGSDVWCTPVGRCRSGRSLMQTNSGNIVWAWADTSPVKAPSCGSTPNHTPIDSRPEAPTRETLVTLADLERE